MAALSTLHPHPTESNHHNSSGAYFMAAATRVPSIPRDADIMPPVKNLFGDDQIGYKMLPPSLVSDAWMAHRDMGAPVDGEEVWYCGECKDGPYSQWQLSCQICQHNKCTTCTVEKK